MTFNVVDTKPRPKTEVTVQFCKDDKPHGRHAYDFASRSIEDGHDYVVTWKDCGGYIVIEDEQPSPNVNRFGGRGDPYPGPKHPKISCNRSDAHVPHIWMARSGLREADWPWCAGLIRDRQCEDTGAHPEHIWYRRRISGSEDGPFKCKGKQRRPRGYGDPNPYSDPTMRKLWEELKKREREGRY